MYTDYQWLQYFNTKQKLNYGQASWYLPMSEFIYHVYYRHGFMIGKPNTLSRRSGAGKSGMDANFFDERQLLDLENNDVGEEQDAKDME